MKAFPVTECGAVQSCKISV